MSEKNKNLLRSLGPGLVFAAAAVGVSHLVQSTRAGAMYGLAMAGLIVLANILKYPAFRFGPHYSAATGLSLLEGYRRQGRWALVLYALLTLGTMFTVQAAVTFVTAALAAVTFGLSLSPIWISAILLALGSGLLVVGGYAWLDRITRVLVGALTISTLAATVMVIPMIDWSAWSVGPIDLKTIAFTAALVGWMPSAIDVAVWQSLWTLAKGREGHARPSLAGAMLDFHIGYIGTAMLALCFMLLGAGVMHGSGVAPAQSGVAFAAQIIGLYEKTLGAWSRPLIGFSALAVMFSTTLAVLDGFPRALTTLIDRFQRPETPGELSHQPSGAQRRNYWLCIALLCVGSLIVIALLLKSLQRLVDVATTLSFLTAPALAILNHRAIMSDDVPPQARPRPWLQALSWIGIISLSVFALAYLYVRFVA